MTTTIFFCWQNKYQEVNRRLIEQSLNEAATSVCSSSELTIDPVIDRDTKGVTGTPDIAATIFEKIRKASLFVADLTLVVQNPGGKKSPNPNVLLEMGYASAFIGWDRIICVMNEACGGPTSLPFDLQNRRWPVRYSVKREASEKRIVQAKSSLVNEFRNILIDANSRGLFRFSVDPKVRRAANSMNRIIEHCYSIFTLALMDNEPDAVKNVLGKDRAGKVADVNAIERLVNLIYSVKGNKNVGSRKKSMSWDAVLLHDLAVIVRDCDRMLDRYIWGDEQMVESIECVKEAAEKLYVCIESSREMGVRDTDWVVPMPDPYKEDLRNFIHALLFARKIAYSRAGTAMYIPKKAPIPGGA